MLRTALLALALLAVATPLAGAATEAGLGTEDLNQTQNHDFVNCAMTHIGYFMDSLNPVHLTHPVAPCFIH